MQPQTALVILLYTINLLTTQSLSTRTRLRNRMEKALLSRGGDENPCETDTPFLCKSSRECIALSQICDGEWDCDDGFDENTHLCNAANRPAVGDLWKFIEGEKHWLLKPFFDGINPEFVAHSMAVSSSLNELKKILGLSAKSSANLESLFLAVQTEDERPLIALGMPANAWHETRFLLGKIIDSGFQI